MIDRRENSIRRELGDPVDADRRQTPFGRRSDDKMTAVVGVLGHFVVADIANDGLRLLDILLDEMSDYVTLFEAHIFSLASKHIQELDEVVIPKSRIQIVAIPGEKHEAPRMRNNRHKQKKQYSAFFTVDRFAVQGMLHLSGSSRAEVVFKEQLGEFFAVNDASVINLFGDGEPVSAQAVIAKSSHVDLLHIGEPNIPKTPTVAEQPTSILDELGL